MGAQEATARRRPVKRWLPALLMTLLVGAALAGATSRVKIGRAHV